MNDTRKKENIWVETEDLRSCPRCKSDRLKLWCKGFDRWYRTSRQEFVYSQCQNCELIFLSSRPVETEIEKFYSSGYQPYQTQLNPGTSSSRDLEQGRERADRQRGALASRIGKKVLSQVSRLNAKANRRFPEYYYQEREKFYQPPEKGLKLLDFGCGSDRFLNQARELGWQTLGVDFYPKTLELIRRSGHQGLLMSPTVWQEIEDSSLDLVRMNHVLEHLYHPQEVLTALKTKMKPGGKLHIAIPNPDSLSYKIFRDRWFGLDCPRHIMLYTPKVLGELLEEIGFSRVKILQEASTKDMARSLGYFLNDIGIIKNEEVDSLKENQDLAKLLHAPARIASSRGAGDRFHAFAHKT